MNIQYYVTPTVTSGYFYSYVIPISENGQSVSAIFGYNFAQSDVFTQVGESEWQFTGKFVYSPNNFKAFQFYSDYFPQSGSFTLRTGSQDYSVNALVPQTPVPEPSFLFIIPLAMALLMRKR